MISDGVLVEIAKNLSEDKDKEALSLMFSDEFKGLAGKIAADTETDRYIYTTEYGDIAVFRADGKANSDLGNTFVYYGRFKNRQRSGDAWWLEVDPEVNAMSFSLSYEDDLPEGEFTRYTYPVGNGDISGDYELTATGSVIHGLFDGDIKFVMRENGEESVTTYEMGDEGMKITDFDPEIQEMDTPDGPMKGYFFMTSDGGDRFILASEVESAGGPEAYMEKKNSGSVKYGILGGHE